MQHCKRTQAFSLTKPNIQQRPPPPPPTLVDTTEPQRHHLTAARTRRRSLIIRRRRPHLETLLQIRPRLPLLRLQPRWEFLPLALEQRI